MINLNSQDDAKVAEPQAASSPEVTDARYYFYFGSIQAHLDRGNYEDEVKDEVKKESRENAGGRKLKVKPTIISERRLTQSVS